MFDIADHLDELRCWPTDRLRRELDVLVGEQRRLRTKELAVLRVLDERGTGRSDRWTMHGESARTVRDMVDTARALESLPEIAAVAYDGDLSAEQLSAVTKFADEVQRCGVGAAGAERGSSRAGPDGTQRVEAVNGGQPGPVRSAVSLRMWWTPDKGMLHLHGQLPDVLGATFEATIQQLTEQAKPAKGQAWDRFEHRAADALVHLCDQPEVGDETPTLAPRPVVQVHVPPHGPAEIAGVPIADSRLEQLRANASIEPVLVDDDGTLSRSGRGYRALSAKIVRAVLLRDHCCRICGRRHRLQIHHLRPRSWGGTDEISDLAAVCTTCHPDLVPHGPYALVGNPNLPDGLDRIHVDDLTPEQREQLGLPPPRAGPTAA